MRIARNLGASEVVDEDAVNALQLAGLIPVGALFGNELGTLLIHRALFKLPTDQHLASEQAIQRILGRFMPPYMIVAIAGAIVAALAADGSPATALGAAAVGCLLVMLAATLRGNVPINNETLRLRPGVDPARWQSLRRRWMGLHAMRVTLDACAFLLICLSIATGS